MKIIQLIQKPQRRGAEIFAAQLSEQLRLAGNEVLLVSIFVGESDLPFYGKWIKLNRPIGYRFFDFKGWKQFSRIVKDFNPDIIQSNAADTLKFSVFSKKLFGWKTSIIYRNANQMGDFIKGSFHRKFNQYLINNVSAVISVSKASRANFHGTFGFPVRNSISIPIGIDISAIDKDLERELKIALPPKFILQIGGLVAEKDPMKMLKMFTQFHKKHPTLHLIFMGSGPLKDELEKQIEKEDLMDMVHLVPTQTNIFPVLARAQALVMPSKIEGLPGVILEAMYCGIPVVAYNVGGIGEVLTNEQTGWCVSAGDSEAFKKSIEEVLSLCPADLERITSAAKALVLKAYQIKNIADEFQRFYLEVSPVVHPNPSSLNL